jgi:hypothetical protein
MKCLSAAAGKALHQLLLSGEAVDAKSLKKIGVDPEIKDQQFGNVQIGNDFWNGLHVKLIDPLKDLTGQPINENRKLLARVKTLYENNQHRLPINDLLQSKIWNAPDEFEVGNFRLTRASFLIFDEDYYNIALRDTKKNIDGLWLDGSISTEKILKVLHEVELTDAALSAMKELDLNKMLAEHLSSYFATVKKGGRSNQGDIDLILGADHNFGIELKLARELRKASASQKAIGQIELYTRQFKGNFLLIVAGALEEKNDKAVAEVVRKAKACGCAYYFLETISGN